MNRVQRGLAALLSLCAFAAGAADEPAPLSLSQALSQAASRPPERLLAALQDVPMVALATGARSFLPRQAAARLEAMARFFDVVLIDLDEAALSERMSTAYVAWERKRTSAPDATETLRGQLAYLDSLARLNAARDNQRRARLSLAIALGAPQLPSEVIDPELPAGQEAPLPESAGQSNDTNDPRRAQALLSARLECDWLVRHERPRAKARNVLAERLLDEARARMDAGEPSDLGNASAAGIEGLRDARQVEFRIALCRERIASFLDGTRKPTARKP